MARPPAEPLQPDQSMPKLIVNPDTPDAWEIQLQPGPNLIGRSPANDFSIAHDSLAAMHCQVTVTERNVILRQLAPASTLRAGTPITEAALTDGDTLQLGEIVMRFENEAAPLPAPATSAPTESAPCRTHPIAAGHHYCPHCHEHFCELCVNRRPVRGRIGRFCRVCGCECDSTSAPAQTATPTVPFGRQIGGAFGYPLQGDGLILLGAGAVFFFVVSFVAGYAFILGLLISLFAAGYLISYYQQILATSATGRDTMPDWPDFTNLGDLLSPIIQFLGVFAVSFGPAIFLNIFVATETSWRPWAIGAALGFGCVYFPMGFMAVALADSLAALNPLVIIPSILKIPGAYLLAILVLVAVLGASWVGNAILPRLLPIPIVPGVLGEFVGLYLMTVEMRLLGLLYRTKQNQLAWFT
jgi:hypothetical protein